MNKVVLFLVTLTVLVLSACSPASAPAAPANTAGQNGAAAPSDMPANMPAAPTNTAQENATPAPQADGKVPVQVTEGDNWIKSNLTTFKVGVTYVFTITNTGNRAHSFSISHPAEKTTDGVNAARASALYLISQDVLTPGTVKTFEFTFKDPAPAGTLEFACLIVPHYKMGQLLSIVVTQ